MIFIIFLSLYFTTRSQVAMLKEEFTVALHTVWYYFFQLFLLGSNKCKICFLFLQLAISRCFQLLRAMFRTQF